MSSLKNLRKSTHISVITTTLFLVSTLPFVSFSAAANQPVATGDAIASATLKGQKLAPSAEIKLKLGVGKKITPNPYLSFLPAESEPDYDFWRGKMQADAFVKQLAKKHSADSTVNPLALLAVGEAEPANTRGQNDTQATAEFVPGFGTGDGDDSEADISGDLKSPAAPTAFTPGSEDDGDINKATDTTAGDGQARTAMGTIGDGPFGSAPLTVVAIGPFAEDDGDITKANVSGAAVGTAVVLTAEIGDGPFGSTGGTPSGDFDVYSLSITAPQTVNVTVAGQAVFDPIVALIDDMGFPIFFNDDANASTSDSALNITFSCPVEPCGAQTYYVMVGGFSQNTFPDNLPSDTSNSSTGPGAGAQGFYELTIAMPLLRTGDFDAYSIVANAGDLLEVEVDTFNYGGVLDPILALYDSAGNILVWNDDDADPQEQSFDSRLIYSVPASGTYYIFVAGFNPSVFPTTPFSFLSDAFDSSSGPGTGSEGDYDIIASRNNIDNDYFSFDLDAGDIIGMNVTGAIPLIGIFDENENLLVATPFETSGIYPASSLLPGGGNASAAYIVSEAGTYAVSVGFGDGNYNLQLRAFRPPQEATGIRQKLFLDFDGATVDTSVFGAGGTQPSVLSPLSSFLGNWGLSLADENDVIDAILATVQQNLDSDLRNNGNNPNFDIEILNSRDHPDTFGDSDTSRIIVGGTIAESGVSTIGIAQSIDIGNFDQAEDSLVLLDLMSAGAGDPNSLNSIPLGNATIVDLIGVGVGNVVSHEAGHFFANFHTDRFGPTSNLQDSGGNMPGTVGVGLDNVFGTADDQDVDFVVDDYAPEESFFGMEDTKNALAFGLTASNQVLPIVVPLPDISSDGIEDVAVLREGSIQAEIRSGANGALQTTMTFLDDSFTPITAAALPDSDGNGIAELGVMASRNSDGRIVVEIRNITGAAAPRSVWFASNHTGVDMAVVEDDADNNGVVELAVLSRRNSDGRGLVEVKNAFGATNPVALWAGPGMTSSDVEVLGDKDANGIPEIAILSTRDSDGFIVAEIKNAAGAAMPTAVWFAQGHTAIDMTAVDDKDSNGIPEVAVLSRRNSDGRNVVEIKNAAGATAPSAVWLSGGFTAIGVKQVHDADVNGVPEIAALSVRDSDGRILVEVKNAFGATNFNALWYSPGFAARGLAILGDTDSNGAEEALVLMIRDSDGRIQVQGRNTAGSAAPKSYWFSP